MSFYYGYSDEFTLAVTEGAVDESAVSDKIAKAQSSLGFHCIDPKYAAMNLSPYLPGLAQILH